MSDNWRVAKSLLKLRDQVNIKWPNRDKSSDGTIGDDRHKATTSEHNPDKNGVVRAEDISNDPGHGLISRKLAEALLASRDPRILYLISNGQIARTYPKTDTIPWQWSSYTGINAHTHHMHISVVEDPAFYDDIRDWNLNMETIAVVPTVPQHLSAFDEVFALVKDFHYDWRDRGQAPRGYINGMCAAYHLLHKLWQAGDVNVLAMAVANTGNDDKDVLSWYNSRFRALGMLNDNDGSDTLRHLFNLMIGLGMRESSGKFCEGWDREPNRDELTSNSAEAGLFQISYNIRAFSHAVDNLVAHYKELPDDPEGLGPIFHNGVSCSNQNLANYGSGNGFEFQRMCKASPMLSILITGLCMRLSGGRLGHWGPLRTRKSEINPDLDILLKQIEGI